MANLLRLGSLAVMLSVVVPILPVQAEEAAGDEWQFEVTPYLFATALDGTVGVRGVTSDVDVSFDQIWDNLDSAFMGMFIARKGDWVIGFDGIYAELGGLKSFSWTGPDGISSLDGELDVTIQMQVYQLSAGRRVLNNEVKADVFAGARYTRLSSNLDWSRTGLVAMDGSQSKNGHLGWWDGVVGAAFDAELSKDWSLIGYADMGGGFAGDSNLTYQVMAGVNWRFAKAFTAKAGYRILYQDYVDDSRQFTWDMYLEGVYAGLGYTF